MAYLDRDDMVARVKMRLNRPATDEVFTVSTADDVIDAALTEEQYQATLRAAPIVPSALMGAPAALTSADGDATFTFGTDVDGAAIIAMGHYHVYQALEDIPDTPLEPGVDYTVEGTLIRIPSNQTRSFADGPYVQFVTPPNVIDGTTEPTILQPLRPYVVSKACARLAAERLKMDPSPYLMASEQDWQVGIAALQTRNGGGSWPSSRGVRTWWWGR